MTAVAWTTLAAGLALLAAAGLSGRRVLVPMVADDEITARVARRGLATALRVAAQSVAGVRSARIRLGRSGLRVVAKAAGARPGLAEEVRAAVDARLANIGPCAGSRFGRVPLGAFGALFVAIGSVTAAHHPSLVLSAAVLVGGVSVLGFACLREVSALSRRATAAPRWCARPAETDTIVMDSAVAAGPVAADIETYAGVRSVTARLLGPAVAPELRLTVTAAPDADVTALRREIIAHALPRLRQALEIDTVAVRLELHFARQSSGPSTRST
ncbi:DUF6286 domain-containing protein [Nocardia sp. NPDC004068]|uniref:DUF6286 domain-containing protein n=1 Tax=Nocardia sp. NPDC004068 TaxID=3364303 RepID=UPI003680B6BA